MKIEQAITLPDCQDKFSGNMRLAYAMIRFNTKCACTIGHDFFKRQSQRVATVNVWLVPQPYNAGYCLIQIKFPFRHMRARERFVSIYRSVNNGMIGRFLVDDRNFITKMQHVCGYQIQNCSRSSPGDGCFINEIEQTEAVRFEQICQLTVFCIVELIEVKISNQNAIRQMKTNWFQIVEKCWRTTIGSVVWDSYWCSYWWNSNNQKVMKIASDVVRDNLGSWVA